MAYQVFKCGYCGEVMGKGHKWEEGKIRFFHFKEKHYKELKELNELYLKLRDLQTKYHYSGWLGIPLEND